jgi:Galactose oxidase, central domain
MLHAALYKVQPNVTTLCQSGKSFWQQLDQSVNCRSAQGPCASMLTWSHQSSIRHRTSPVGAMAASTQLHWTVRTCTAACRKLFSVVASGDGSTRLIFKLQEVAKEQSRRPDLPRSGHCSVTLPEDHSADVLIFGGYTETADKQRQACNDTWVFDAAKNWSQLQTVGRPPRVCPTGRYGPRIAKLLQRHMTLIEASVIVADGSGSCCSAGTHCRAGGLSRWPGVHHWRLGPGPQARRR